MTNTDEEVTALMASAVISGVRECAEVTSRRGAVPVLARGIVETRARNFISDCAEIELSAQTRADITKARVDIVKTGNVYNDRSLLGKLNLHLAEILSVDFVDRAAMIPPMRDPDDDVDCTWAVMPYWGQEYSWPQPTARVRVLDTIVFRVPGTNVLRERVSAIIDDRGRVWAPWCVGAKARAGGMRVWLSVDERSLPTDMAMTVAQARARLAT